MIYPIGALAEAPVIVVQRQKDGSSFHFIKIKVRLKVKRTEAT